MIGIVERNISMYHDAAEQLPALISKYEAVCSEENEALEYVLIAKEDVLHVLAEKIKGTTAIAKDLEIQIQGIQDQISVLTEKVNVVTFTEMSRLIGVDRADLLSAFSAENHDAVSSAYLKDGHPHYLVAYNMRLPAYLVQRALAREMGHLVLGHDGSRRAG